MTIIEDAYRRFSTERFPLPRQSQVEDLEHRIKVVFPEDYRRYLLEFNGGYFTEPEIETVVEGCPHLSLTCMDGIGASHKDAELGRPLMLQLFDDNDPPKILPIGSTAMGSLIILDTAPGDGRGEIYLKEAYGDFYWMAEGVEDFFRLLRVPSWGEG